jgi:SAM-dependent methyltransferase
VAVVMANEEMAAAWDEEAEGWIADAERYERAGERHWTRFLQEVEISGDDRALDIGCGAGSSTIDIARRAPDGEAVGIDISRRMIEHARRAAEAARLTNVHFQHADAQVHPLGNAAYDLAVSVFGTMFFNDAVAAFTNIAAALRPAGRLAVLTWQELSRNEWLTALRGALAVGRQLPEPPAGAPGPFAQADPDHVRSVLGRAGLTDIELLPSEEPMWFGADVEDAYGFLQTFGITKGLTEGLAESDRARALEALRQTVADHETPEGVLFGSAAWLVRARAGSER